mmetsp:Transcript_46180/g.53468  ORF Transcript_46180/g.53468 Transcript_46180/m.53468 type:complete len:511 (+) Transcript_46180:33-1565(+)
MGCACSKNKGKKGQKGANKADKYADNDPNMNIQGHDPLQGKRFSVGDFIKKKNTSFYKDYEFIKELGKGAFGEVVEAMHKDSKQHRAVKIISHTGISETEREEIFKEIETLKRLDHPNVMKIYEYYVDDNHIFIIGEIYNGGELLEKIVESKQFTEKKAADIMRQILLGVNYCHQNKIVHRDLKPQNILFDTKGEDAALKIVDFGVSANIEPNMQFNRATGTPLFMAPEVLNKNYNEKCDLWSCGVILYILLSGELPFKGKTKDAILKKIQLGQYTTEGPIWEKISAEGKSFLKKLMMFDPKARYSAEKALQDPWITKAHERLENNLIQREALENIRTYRATTKLQEAFYLFISSYFARKEEKNTYLKVFQKLDRNGDGQLTRDELLKGFAEINKFGFNEKEVDELLKQADSNGNGVIDYGEFVAASINRKTLLDKERLEAAFNLFDKDGNGELTMDEIKEVFSPGEKNMNDEEWVALIKEVDKNKDGKINYTEFRDLMIQIAESGLPQK